MTWLRKLRKQMLSRPRIIRGRQSKHICRERCLSVFSNRRWEKSDFWTGSITFVHLFGEDWNAIVLVVVPLISQRSGLKTQFPLHRKLLLPTARGCFKSDRETSVLASSWKSPKPSCVVSLCLTAAWSNCRSRATNRALLLLWFFCSLVSRSEVRT